MSSSDQLIQPSNTITITGKISAPTSSLPFANLNLNSIIAAQPMTQGAFNNTKGMYREFSLKGEETKFVYDTKMNGRYNLDRFLYSADILKVRIANTEGETVSPFIYNFKNQDIESNTFEYSSEYNSPKKISEDEVVCENPISLSIEWYDTKLGRLRGVQFTESQLGTVKWQGSEPFLIDKSGAIVTLQRFKIIKDTAEMGESVIDTVPQLEKYINDLVDKRIRESNIKDGATSTEEFVWHGMDNSNSSIGVGGIQATPQLIGHKGSTL
jgi:hypothetical protein